jgi:hypothetical protein
MRVFSTTTHLFSPCGARRADRAMAASSQQKRFASARSGWLRRRVVETSSERRPRPGKQAVLYFLVREEGYGLGRLRLVTELLKGKKRTRR